MKSNKENNEPNYICPICNTQLKWREGGKMHKEGYTMFCDNPVCPCEEVFGYSSKNLEDCFDTIKAKYYL